MRAPRTWAKQKRSPKRRRENRDQKSEMRSQIGNTLISGFSQGDW
jgi:hypothetical protein